jgi:ferredoxin
MRRVVLTVNGVKMQVDEGLTILEAAAKNKIHIPTLCHHPLLRKVGTCRVCLVESQGAQGSSKLIPACVTPVANGMTIETQVNASSFVVALESSKRHSVPCRPGKHQERFASASLQTPQRVHDVFREWRLRVPSELSLFEASVFVCSFLFPAPVHQV